MRKHKSSDSGGELKPEKCRFSDGEGPSYAPETDKDGEGSAAAAAPGERTSREGTGEKKRKARKSGKGVSSKLDESGVSAEASVSSESTQVAMAEKSEQGVESKLEKCSVSNGEGLSSAPEADVVMVEKGAEGSAAAAAPGERTSREGTGEKKRKVRKSRKGVSSKLDESGVSAEARVSAESTQVAMAEKSEQGVESKPEKCSVSNGEGLSSAPEANVVMVEKGAEGSAAAASAPEERTSREGTGEKKRKVQKSRKGVSSKLDESGISAEASVSAEFTQVAMAEKSEQGVELKPEKCSVSNGEGLSSAPEVDVVMVEKGAEGSAAAAAAAPEERTSGDGAADDVVKKRKVRRSGKEEGEEGAAAAAAAAAHLDGLQQMAGDNSDADVMRKRKSRKSGKRVSSELEESGVLMEATEVMMAGKSKEGGKPKLENHSVSNGDAVDGVGGSSVPEEFRANDVVMAEKGEEGSAIKAAAALLEEQTFGDGTRAKEKKVRKSGKGVSGKSVESGVSAEAIQVVMADKSEEGAAAALLDGAEQHARSDVVKKKKVRKTVKEVGSVPPQATDVVIGEKSEEGTAAALLDGTGHRSSKHAKVRKSGKGVSSVLEVVGVPLQAADVVMADKGEEGVGEHLGADVLQKRKVSKSVKAVRTKTELGVSSEASKVVEAKKGEEGAGPSERLQRTAEDHSVVDGVKKTKSGKSEKGTSSVPEAAACVSLRVTNVAMEGKGEVAAGPSDGYQLLSRDHLIANAGKKSKSWMSGEGASSTADGSGAPVQASADVGMVEKIEFAATLSGLLSHGQMAGDHTGAEVTPKTKGRKRDRVSSTHDESGEPILEKSEECAATLSGPSSHDRMARAHSGVDVTPKTKGRKSGKGASSIPGELGAPTETIDVVMAMNSEEGGGPLNGSPVSLSVSGQNRKSPKSTKVVSRMADQLEASQQATAVVMAKKSEEGAAPLDGLPALPSAGDHTGANVLEKRKIGKIGLGETSTPQKLKAPPQVVMALPASGSPTEACITQTPGVRLNSDEVRRQKKSSKMKSNKNPITDSMTCTSLDSSNPVPLVNNESNVVSGSDNIEADMISQIKADSDKGSNLHVQQKTQNKRKEKVSHHILNSSEQNCGDSSISTSSSPVGIQLMERNNDVAAIKNDLNLNGTSTNGSTMPNIVAVDMVRKTDNETSCSDNILSSFEKENGGLTSRASAKSGLEKEPISQSDNLNVCGTRRRRHKKRVSQFNAKLESGTSSTVNSSMDLEFLPKSPIDASDKNLSILPVGSRDGVLRQASDSLLSEDPSLALTKTPDRSSPIRGVVVQHDFASADLLDRQNNQLESLIAEEACFSFQLGSGVAPVNGFTKKKLLVLDLNGILTDIVTDYRVLRNVHKAHQRIGGKAVFKRPFCDEFLKFCFERFDIGIWSSRKMYNVTDVVDYLMPDTKHKLLFSWDQSRCTVTRFKTMENSNKPLVLKELRRLWNKEDPDLPWEKGEYSPSNTLLVDDSPYKALCNPPYTAIFPRPFSFYDDNDNSLGPGGDLRVYLEGIAGADDVQQYVQAHPFGQKAITSTDPSWKFYRSVIQSATARLCC